MLFILNREVVAMTKENIFDACFFKKYFYDYDKFMIILKYEI